MDKVYGVYRWLPGIDDDHSEANVEQEFDEDMLGRVCEIIRNDGSIFTIKYGSNTYKVNFERMMIISNAKFGMNDHAIYKDNTGVIADIIWHHKKEEPMYFLEFDGKRSSRRYFNDELGIVAA